MNDMQACCYEDKNSIIVAVCNATDLRGFLKKALNQAVEELCCSRGSVYLFEGSTNTLRLFRRTKNDKCRIHLGINEGITGDAFKKGGCNTYCASDLNNNYIALCKEITIDKLRAIVTIAICHDNKNKALFCFEYDKNDHDQSHECLTESEKERVSDLDRKLRSVSFSNALYRTIVNQTHSDIWHACNNTAQLRKRVSEYLNNIMNAFSMEGRRPPDIAYLQLVDHRRSIIRTIQGVGMPLSFQRSLSHPLDSKDIQAHIVRERIPMLIVGKDPLFNQDIYEKFNHKRFVRLWIPLFPFPESKMIVKPGHTMESVISNALTWEAQDTYCEQSRRIIGRWQDGVAKKPPEKLIFGTLEIGYIRDDENNLKFDPLTIDMAGWMTAQAYKYSRQLFCGTLPAALDMIAKSVANLAYPDKVILSTAMTNWNCPEERSYPDSFEWPVALPKASQPVHPAPEMPSIFIIDHIKNDRDGYPESKHEKLLKYYTAIAENAIRVTMRLDDQHAQQYILLDDRERRNVLGTEYPNPYFEEIAQEICRESSADRCILMLFEEEKKETPDPDAKTNNEGKWNILGLPHFWPKSDKMVIDDSLNILSKTVLKNRTAAYDCYISNDELKAVAVLPLELGEQQQMIAIMEYSEDDELSESRRRELEGRITLWIYRLSLRNLKIINRFTKFMRHLRTEVMKARGMATEKDGCYHMQTFSESFLRQSMELISARAAIMTLFSNPSTGPAIIERFWTCKDKHQQIHPVDHDIFVDQMNPSPCRKAKETYLLGLYQNYLPDFITNINCAIDELRTRAEEKREKGFEDVSERLYELIGVLSDQNNDDTMLVIPLRNRSDPSNKIAGALTYIIPGIHDLNHGQKELVHELGILIADTLDQLQKMDANSFEKNFVESFDAFRKDLAKAKCPDEAVGCLLKIAGAEITKSIVHKPGSCDPPNINRKWRLSDNVVIWLLFPGYRELVTRSCHGKGLEVLGQYRILEPNDHPLLSNEINPDYVPKKEPPTIDQFRIWTFDLYSESSQQNNVLKQYQKLDDCRWLVSFPLIQADNSLIGVIDCPREESLRPEEERVLCQMLRRISLQVCASLDRCRFERAISVARELTDEAGKELDAFRAPTAYKILVGKVRDELGMTHCDLYLDRDGKMLLYATTRDDKPIGEEKRQLLCVSKSSGDEILGATLNDKRTRSAHASDTPVSLEHLSPSLRSLISEDYHHERLCIRLGKKREANEDIPGMLYLCGPISQTKKDGIAGEVINSGLVTYEYLKRAIDLSVVIYRNAMMAQLVERKGWLIDELQHYMGQPLQVLRCWSDNLLTDIARNTTFTPKQIHKHKLDQARGFDLVHEVRSQLAIYAKMSQPMDKMELSKVHFNGLVKKTCDFLKPEASRKKCKINYKLQSIRPITGNESLLKAAVINLIDNAIKYSYDDREIVVVLNEEPRGTLTLTVENYGVGIPEPDLPRIFEPYFRSHVKDKKGARKGSGIGLAIVRHAVEIVHQGKVDVVSIPPRDKPPSLSAAEVAEYPHKTTFTMILSRESLNKLADTP